MKTKSNNSVRHNPTTVLRMSFRESTGIFLRGIAMGMADIVPGVSGGTVALITGIYERLVKGISDLGFSSLKRGAGETDPALKTRKIDLELFVPLVLGIALAIVLMSNIIAYLLDSHTSPTYAFFFTLILASALLLLKERHLVSLTNGLFIILGFAITFILVDVGVLEIDHSLPVIFISGMIAICAMILPGISGALILLFLGQYEYLLNALRTISWPDILAFCIGGVIGLLAFSRVLNYLIKNHRLQTISFLIGLMLGALRLPYKEIVFDSNTIYPVMFAGIAGFMIIFLLEIGQQSARRKYKKR